MAAPGQHTPRPLRHLDARLRPSTKVLPEQTRAHNRALVLQQLFRSGTSSRAAIARATGLTRVTVSDLVNGLIAEGFVEELGVINEPRAGKPATRIGMRTESFQVVSLDLADRKTVRGAVMTLSGRFVVRRSYDAEGRTGEDLVDLVERLCRSLVASATVPVLGVAVGCPGVVTPAGVVTHSPHRGWEDVPLAELLESRIGLPVQVSNDANLATLGEFTFGGASESGLMVLVLREGVGAGIMVDGQLVDGVGHAAGEIGHVTVVRDGGERCECGRDGCLETLVSVNGLTRALESAARGEAVAVLAAAGRVLGAILAPVVSALNLVQISLSGPRHLFEGVLREATLAALRERTMPAIADRVSVEMASLGDDVVLAGGTALVLSNRLGIS